MKKIITINNGSEIHLDTELLPKHFNRGTTHLGRTILSNDEIYVPPKKTRQNTVRAGHAVDVPHGDKIAAKIENSGIDNTQQPPAVVKRDVTDPESGKKYQYELSNLGNHRRYAFGKIGATHWIYDVYKPWNDKFAEDDAGLKGNDISPFLPMSKKGITNILIRMVKEKRWGSPAKEKLEEILLDYLQKHASSWHNLAHKSMIKQVFHSYAEYLDHVEYAPAEADDWVSTWTNRETYGKIDKKRKVHSFVVGEGYEKKKVMLSIIKYGEDKLPSEFIGHTKQPISTDKTKQTTKLKRNQMLNAFKELESDLDAAYEYKKEHGVYPFKLVGFIPQDRKNTENFEEFVPISKAV